jgi:hypothetical protein
MVNGGIMLKFNMIVCSGHGTVSINEIHQFASDPLHLAIGCDTI